MDIKENETAPFAKNLDSLDYVQASSIQMVAIKWLWKFRIALGKITVFAGEGGTGKSTLLIKLAALITKGDKFPVDKSEFPKGVVIILSAEDAENDTLIPRLVAAGADLDSIIFLRGTKEFDADGKECYSTISFDKDLARINNVIKEIGNVVAVIVDPASAYLGGINDNSNAEVRSLLTKMSRIAEDNTCAFILNAHLSKPGSNIKSSAANRVMGSSAWVNAARACYLISKDPENPVRRLFLPIKNNIGNDTEGFVYQIKATVVGEDKIHSTYVEFFDEIISTTANDIISGDKTEKVSALEDAKDFLLKFLEFGSKPLEEIQEAAKKKDISIPTLYRAKDALNISVDYSVSRVRGKIWYLSC